MYGFLYEFPKCLALGKREVAAGFYQPTALYLGKIISFIPGILFEIVLTTSIFYFVVGLHVFNLFGFLVTLAVGFTCSLVALGFGTLFGLMFASSPSLSGSSVSVAGSVALAMAGFYLNEKSFPDYISWAKYLSW
jgi:hypothetical protein